MALGNVGATAIAVRELFAGTCAGGLTWAARHALDTAMIAPLLLTLIFTPSRSVPFGDSTDDRRDPDPQAGIVAAPLAALSGDLAS
ncbi:hypothetical protein [Streptosporangium canum]|uniref:hypothetical protein n=1 Tax=Streptosporangium canum TaxID=324952 RepID=UPI0033AA954F